MLSSRGGDRPGCSAAGTGYLCAAPRGGLHLACAMAGGRLKIDYLASGAVVKAFQVQDACHKGVLDAAHTVTAYWYGKNKAASLFGTGPVFGANASQR